MSSAASTRASDAAVTLRRAGVVIPLAGRPAIRGAQLAVAIAIVPVAVSAVWLALLSDHVERPVATALYRSYLAAAPMLIGVYWWHRRPASRFGPLLIVFGLVAWVVSWQSSDRPLAFDLGVLAEGPLVVLTLWLFLAFPSGRLTTVADRVLITAAAIVVLGFFLPWALGSPVIAGGGPLSGCDPACPDNVLQIGSAPRLVSVLGRWETYTSLVVVLAVLVVYALRVRAASRPRRRALIAVAATSLLFLPVFLVYHFSSGVLELDAATLETMSWVLVAARVLLPLGFLAALFQADLFAGVARGRLLEELVTRPSPERWRDAVARALDDPELRLAYWDPGAARYRQPDGEDLSPPAGTDLAWLEVDRDGRPAAAMVVDAVLAEDPELVQAATAATMLAVEHGHMESELRDSEARVRAAGGAERRRIERDLHDTAQQRLVALRIHLALASERIDDSVERSLVERLGAEVEAALDDLRSVAGGAYPETLRRAGVGPALRAISHGAAIATRVEDRWRRRHGEEVELAVYCSCLEALQNAAKHGGPGCVATVRLMEGDGRVGFAVEDDGVGFDPDAVRRGAGLANIAERVAAAGGTLRVESAPGEGTRVTGRLPA